MTETISPPDIRAVALTTKQIEQVVAELAAKQLPVGDSGKPIRIEYNGTEWVGLPAGAFVSFRVES